MTPEEIYLRWAPESSPWSAWVIPVPFAQLTLLSWAQDTEPQLGFDLGDLAGAFHKDVAIVVDLPGAQLIPFGLALARLGYRPVPVIDGSPGPSQSVVDMTVLLRELQLGAEVLDGLTIPRDAPPAFLLDAARMKGHHALRPELFDNRWKTFPQDFPSGRFLQEHGIGGVLLVQENAGQPQEDLAHVLLRWEEAGLRLKVFGTRTGGSSLELNVNRPSHFRMLWQRALAMLGLRRASIGGFGNWPQSTGGG